MSKIAVVIPTRNRKEHLVLGLVALANQARKDFEVIIADDGSTDGTYQALMNYKTWEVFSFMGGSYKYYWQPHPNPWERLTSLARNQGARLVAKGTTHILFNDTDVLLNPRAIEHYYKLIEQHPGVVICGRYDWLPPMEVTPEDVISRWDDLAAARLSWTFPGYSYSEVGIDPRRQDWDSGEEISKYGGSTFAGNLLIPMEAFEKTGGFDEDLKERGQDSEFGRNLESHGFKVIFSAKVIGYHLSHFKDRRAETISVRKSIKYICKKYGKPFKDSMLPPLDN